MAANGQSRTLNPPIRWAAFTGIALLVVRRWLYTAFPNLLPSGRWRPESWRAGALANAGFELIVLVLLLGVPVCIYFFRLRTPHTGARDLAVDCAAAVGLYMAALLLL